MTGPLMTDIFRSMTTLIASALVVMGSPGPTNLSAAAVGAAFGVRRSAPYVVGLALGTLAVLAAVAAGFASLVSTVPMAALLIRIVGIAYILYLAWQIAIAPPLTTDTNDVSTPTLSAGFLLGVANPKAYFAISAVMASATLIPDEPVADVILKIGMLAALVALIQATWLLLGLLLARVMADPSRSRPINIGMALLLVASAIGSVLP
jgi:threonine/homoserine/homoserine lactone efflux protein